MDRLGRKVIYHLQENKPLELTDDEKTLLRHRFLHVFPFCVELGEEVRLEVEDGVLSASVVKIENGQCLGKSTLAKCDIDSLVALFELTYDESDGR